MKTTVLRNAHLITLDPHLGDISHGDLLIADDAIAAVGDIPSQSHGDVIDCTNLIAIPGFVDTHRHTWQSAIRHTYADRDPAQYFAEVLRGTGAAYTPSDVHVGNLLGAVSALSAGTTTLFDWSHIQNTPSHADAAVSGLRQAGVRAVFGHGWPLTDDGKWSVNSQLGHPHDIRRVQAELISADAPLITLAMAARGPEMAAESVWRSDLELARDLGLRSSIHVGAYPHNAAQSAVRKMRDAGVLDSDITFVHCCRTSSDELSMIADAGASVSLGPHCEMNSQGIGNIPLDRLLARGIRPSLSGDTETKCSGDMFTQMRMLFGHHRSWMGGGNSSVSASEAVLTLRDVLEFATIQGAKAVGLEESIGTLTPGKQADIVLIRATDLNLAPVLDPVAAVVLAAHEGNVDTVFVAGRAVKRGGSLKQVNTEELLAAARESQQAIIQRRRTA